MTRCKKNNHNPSSRNTINPSMHDTFNQLRPKLFGLAYRILGSSSEAEDVAI